MLDTEPIVFAAAATTNEHVQLPGLGPSGEIPDNFEEEQTVSLLLKEACYNLIIPAPPPPTENLSGIVTFS